MCGVVLNVVEQHRVRHAVTHEVGKDSNEDKLPENNSNIQDKEKKCNCRSVHMCAHVHVHVCVYVCVCVCIHVCMHVDMCACMCTCVFICVCQCLCLCRGVCVCDCENKLGSLENKWHV